MPGANTVNQVGFQNLVVSGAPVGLTRPVNERPRHALIGVSGGAIRWLAVPGQDPTASFGSYVGAGGTIDWSDVDKDYAGLLDNVTFIKAGANDANLEVSYFA